MQKALNGLLLAEKALTVAVFALMTAVSVFQVVNRNILHYPIGWTEEVARYCQVWLALLGTQIGLRSGGQMAIQVLTGRLKGVPARIVGIAADLIILAFCVIVVVFSLDLMAVQVANGQVSSALKLPMTIPYAAMPFCFTVMSLSQLVRIYRHVIGEERHRRIVNAVSHAWRG